MTCPLWPPTIPSNALKSNAMKMRQTVQNVALVNWKTIIFVQNHVGIWSAHSASKKTNVWNATQKLTQNLQYFWGLSHYNSVLLSTNSSGIFRFGWDFRRILIDSSVSDFILAIWAYFSQFWRFRRSFSGNLDVFWSFLTF